MNPPKISIVDHEGLVELLNEIFDRPTRSREEIDERFRRACQLAYSITRNAMDCDKCLMSDLSETAIERMTTSSGVNAVTGTLICAATAQFLDIKWKQNKELFKTEFILALDRAIESAGRSLEESYDTCTEQSASQRPNQSPTTP